MSKIKLTEKQLSILNQIQARKREISAVVQELDQKQSIVIELVFENNKIDANDVANINLEEDCLVVEFKQKAEALPKKAKKVQETEKV